MNEPNLNTYQLAGVSMGALPKVSLVPTTPMTLAPAPMIGVPRLDVRNVAGATTSGGSYYDRHGETRADTILRVGGQFLNFGAGVINLVNAVRTKEPVYINDGTGRERPLSEDEKRRIIEAEGKSDAVLMAILSEIRNNNNAPQRPLTPPPTEKDNTLLYVALGGGVLLLLGIGAVVMMSNKK